MTILAATPDDVYARQWWTFGMLVVITLIQIGVFAMQCYKVHLHRLSNERDDRIEAKFDDFLARTEPKLQTMVNAAELMATVAKSYNRESKRHLEKTEAVVEKGIVDAAAVVAQAAGNPLSGDKLPRPPLPPDA